MTTLRVDPEAISALGRDLRVLAGVLAGLEALDGGEVVDLGHRSVAGALDELLGNWSLVRRQLAQSLDDLGAVAGQAGAAYLEVEGGIVESLGCRPVVCPGAGRPR